MQIGPRNIDYRPGAHPLLRIIEANKSLAFKNKVTFLGIMMVQSKLGTGLKFQYAETEAVSVRVRSID
jgi:hypothetical protein